MKFKVHVLDKDSLEFKEVSKDKLFSIFLFSTMIIFFISFVFMGLVFKQATIVKDKFTKESTIIISP